MTKNQAISPIDGYQQALEDFAIPNLLTRLKTYSDADFDAAWMNLTQPELESLAAILSLVVLINKDFSRRHYFVITLFN